MYVVNLPVVHNNYSSQFQNLIVNIGKITQNLRIIYVTNRQCQILQMNVWNNKMDENHKILSKITNSKLFHTISDPYKCGYAGQFEGPGLHIIGHTCNIQTPFNFVSSSMDYSNAKYSYDKALFQHLPSLSAFPTIQKIHGNSQKE